MPRTVRTAGIVLQKNKYKESSLIARIFTAELGMVDCILYRVHPKRSKQPIAFFHLLNWLDLIIYTGGKSLKRVKEVAFIKPWYQIFRDQIKLPISFFLVELLQKTLRESDSQKLLFHWLTDQLEALESVKLTTIDPLCSKKCALFLIKFLLRLFQHLGLEISAPVISSKDGPYPMILLTAQGEEFLNSTLQGLPREILYRFSLATHVEILQALLSFYSDHIASLQQMNTWPMLKGSWGL